MRFVARSSRRRPMAIPLFSAGSRWPACLGGFLNDFAMVERSEFARLAENTAVHDDGVDIARLRQRDKRLVRVADRCHIDIRGADQDDVSPLAGRERAGFLGEAEVNRAVERGELHDFGNDDRARQLAVASLDILQGTLLRPLHRKTRLAAFGALANAAKADREAAARVLRRARDAMRLPDKKYPKEQLVGLVGQILHAWPELCGPRERPVIYGLEEAIA